MLKDKLDLVMWTKNGARTLAPVLEQINRVVPKNLVNKKIIVDDSSTDSTLDIAVNKGWMIVPNSGTGISDGANTALSFVETEKFCSFEQDLLLSPEWVKVVSLLDDKTVAAASGMRFASCPDYLAKLQKYVAKKYRGEKHLSGYLKGREFSSFTLGKTLDNTIFRTKAVRSLGGFPKIATNAGVDTVLAYKMMRHGMEWKVDYNVQSIHLRCGFRDELRHQYSYGTQLKSIWASCEDVGVMTPINSFGVLSRLIYSPLSGIWVALKTREPRIMFAHPLIRYYYAKGLLNS